MKNHLSDNVLQALALDQQQVNEEMITHLEQCDRCREALANYQLLFTALKTVEKPSLEIDIEALVMPQLPKPAPVRQPVGWGNIWLAALGVAIFSVPLFITGRFIRNLFKEVPVMMLSIILVGALIIVGFLLREIINSYKERKQLLNFYQ
jgi:uncharacterized membrane protein YcjF (UPF0283 family)